jgi:hypothetical protein
MLSLGKSVLASQCRALIELVTSSDKHCLCMTLSSFKNVSVCAYNGCKVLCFFFIVDILCVCVSAREKIRAEQIRDAENSENRENSELPETLQVKAL